MAEALPLVCHEQTPAPWLRGIAVRVAAARDGGLTLVYAFCGDLRRLRVPPPAAPGRADGLWRHTCCEVFVVGSDAPAYREFNFSPGGAWQAYAFRGYRDGGPLQPVESPVIHWHSTDCILTASMAPGALPPGRRLRLGLTAVVEDAQGRLSYWALRHPPGRPDFHHTDGFALDLELPP